MKGVAGIVVVALLSTAIAMWQWTKLAARLEGLQARVHELESAPAATAPAADLAPMRAELRACQVRTDYLHTVQVAMCKPDGYGQQRVHPPDPPPGWASWPVYPEPGHE